MTTTGFHPTTDYRACVDPLHRNTWPVRIGDDETVIGYLTEHITVTLDLPQPPVNQWSWKFDDAEADRLRIEEDLRHSRIPRYRSWRRALEVFASMHQLASSLRSAEDYLAAERAKRGE